MEKLSLVDYDGYSVATVFTALCNFRCPFCHNGSLVLGGGEPTLTEEEVFTYLTRRRGLLDGVCITGGEPTLDPGLAQFAQRVKELGYLVKLDTNGTRPDVLKDLVNEGLLDYVAMDIKNSLDAYPVTVGLKQYDTARIRSSIAFLLSGKVNYEFRTTLAEELHTRDNIVKMGELIAGADKMFLQCYKDTENNITHTLHAVPREVAEEYRTILGKTVGQVTLRGY